MKKLDLFSKIIIYLILIAGSMLFVSPLIWMVVTALKPINQTMTLPPSWLPYAYNIKEGNKKIPVELIGKVYISSFLVKLHDSGDLALVPQKHIKNNVLIIKRGGGAPDMRKNVTILEEIPASEKEPWAKVSWDSELLPDKGKNWAFLPEKRISRKVSFQWKNFAEAIKAMKYFPQYLKNTLLLCLLTVFGTVSSSAIAAYGFSRIEWCGRDKVFILALATMMIPFPVIMVPVYCLFRTLGMIGTLQPLWVGSFFAGAFNVFLLRQFFIGIPKSLSDAARIDGCSEFQIFLKIILPMSKPALMVVGLFQFMGTWNDFLGPLLYLTKQKDFTLALGLQFFQSQSGGTQWNHLMAASSLVIIPVMVLFFFTQKSFIEGVSTSGIKG